MKFVPLDSLFSLLFRHDFYFKEGQNLRLAQKKGVLFRKWSFEQSGIKYKN